MRTARIGPLQAELAPQRPSDGELAATLAVDVDTVARLSQRRLRSFAPDGVGPAELAAVAARDVLARGALSACDVDLILFSTNTPDLTFPGSACLLQDQLDAATVACLDVRSQCCGFLVGLETARRFIETGSAENVLLAAGEVPSHQNRFDGEQLELACLTSDAAAVCLVQAGEGPGRILASVVETDGRLHRLLWCEYPSSRHLENRGVARGQRVTREAIERGLIYPRADVAGLRDAALERLPGVFEAALSEAGVDHVNVLLVRHLLPEVEAELADRLAAKADRVLEAETLYAYSASLPLGLARALQQGFVGAGETVALLTAGSGASWGAAIVEV